MRDPYLTKEQLVKREYTASRELEAIINAHIETMKDDEIVLYLAYTDYGGSSWDHALIEYLRKNYKKEFGKTIHAEYTGYYGQNCFIFGELAKRIKEASEDYPLGFENFEDFYYEMESKAINRDLTDFRKYLRRKYVILRKDDSFELMKDIIRDGYFKYDNSFNSVDFNEENLINLFLEAELIKKRN